MVRRLPACVLLGALAALGGVSALGQDEQRTDVRIVSTISTKKLCEGVARAMKQEKGLVVIVSQELVSADALEALAERKVDLAILTRPLTVADRAQYPSLDLVATPVGMQVVALGVSGDLWDAGVHAISQQDMRSIYEQKIKNWKEAGGPDEKITLFNFTQGTGVWEIMTEWLYGDNRKAPLPKVEVVSTSQDARDALEFTPGAVAPMGAAFVDGKRCHALGIRLEGHIAEAVPQDAADGSYPIVRPILAVSIGRPVLGIRTVTDFLAGPEGQALVKSTGALGREAVPKSAVAAY